ncbi:biotin synthase BioB [Herbivorax sp. ANBcel31]|uniref:biotin synthase BioB n=1 Tax=Herbivorax sp. ANBcel31 TaxID=3069754 RepID=UPI0027B2F64E|nr:biotin synthase BioB [Herbivorax sp. ANBcel31]MDQ2085320.1 biotin synthase BioB [Herbivorax sp. ANBcel31]
MKEFILNLKQKILNGESITFDEAVTLLKVDEEDTNILFESSNEIRQKLAGKKANLCTILNARSGKCSENCKYCAQSTHYNTEVLEYDLLDYEEILEKALEVQKNGAHRFSLVTSGKGIDRDKDIEKLSKIYQRLSEDTNLKLCASHGIITYQQAKKLKDAGVSMYHHNIETSSSHYKNICTSHTYEDRIKTIENVKKAGMEVCCGGIIGMNESLEDRIRMAFEIKSLNIKSIPVNVLNPIKGTPFEDLKVLSPMEILKTMAVYRFILPDSYIRYAGGRMALKDKQALGFKAGINAALTGNYLTTTGSNVDQDKDMIIEAGFSL